MEKKIGSIIIIAALSLIGCSNGISGLEDDDQVGSDSIAQESIAQYQYLGVMYDSTEGKALNDEVLRGEIYNIYRDKVQTALNVYLHFPLDQGTSPQQGVGGQVINALFSTGGSGTTLATPWYETLPQGIKDHAQFHITETMAEAIALGLASFLRSTEGEAVVNQYLDKVQNRSNQVVEHGVDELAGVFQEEIDSMEGVFCATSVISALSGTMFMEPVAMAELFMSQNNHSQLMGKLEKIQHKLVAIHNTIFKLENRMDAQTGMELEDYSGALGNAQGLITDIYNQLDFLQEDPDARKELIENYICTSVEYERIFREAFEKAQQRVDKYEEVNGVKKNDLQILIQFYTNNKWLANFNFYINNSVHLTKISLQDISILKRLSDTRLSLSRELYCGSKLLKFRAVIAQKDILKVHSIREQILINGIMGFNDNIHSLLTSEIQNNYKSTGGRLFDMFMIDPNTYYTGFCYVPPISISCTEKTIVYVKNDMIIDFTELVEPNGNTTYLTGSVTSHEAFMNALRSTIEDIVMYNLNNDYFVQALTMLAAWEIHLRAHIKAGEGL